MTTRDLVAKRDEWAQRAAEWLQDALEVIKARSHGLGGGDSGLGHGGGDSGPNDLAQRRRDAAQAYDRAFAELMSLPPAQRTSDLCAECDRLERVYDAACDASQRIQAASA